MAATETSAGRAAMPDTEAPATWSVRLPVLIQVAHHDVPHARRVAVEELNQMAREADAARAMLAALRNVDRWHDQLRAGDLRQVRAAIALAERAS